MAKLLWVYLVAILSIVLKTEATTYMVGDTSGWDISSSLETWSQDKVFKVGDVLMFIYSSSDTVDEVTRESFDKCNTSNVLRTYSSGNTTISLSEPGDKYFISGNKLYCLGGMKLRVHVVGDQAASPVSASQAQPKANLPVQPSSKSNKPSAVVPNSSGFPCGKSNYILVAFLGFMAFVLSIVQV